MPKAADGHVEGSYGKCGTAGTMLPEGIGLKENCTKQNTIREYALLLMALAVWTEPALARSYLNCLTKKVVIVEAPRAGICPTSSMVKIAI